MQAAAGCMHFTFEITTKSVMCLSPRGLSIWALAPSNTVVMLRAKDCINPPKASFPRKQDKQMHMLSMSNVSAPYWLHCNHCGSMACEKDEDMSKFSLTSCGHVICNECVGERPESCFVCEHSPLRVQPIDETMNAQLRKLFMPPALLMTEAWNKVQRVIAYRQMQFAISTQILQEKPPALLMTEAWNKVQRVIAYRQMQFAISTQILQEKDAAVNSRQVDQTESVRGTSKLYKDVASLKCSVANIQQALSRVCNRQIHLDTDASSAIVGSKNEETGSGDVDDVCSIVDILDASEIREALALHGEVLQDIPRVRSAPAVSTADNGLVIGETTKVHRTITSSSQNVVNGQNKKRAVNMRGSPGDVISKSALQSNHMVTRPADALRRVANREAGLLGGAQVAQQLSFCNIFPNMSSHKSSEVVQNGLSVTLTMNGSQNATQTAANSNGVTFPVAYRNTTADRLALNSAPLSSNVPFGFDDRKVVYTLDRTGSQIARQENRRYAGSAESSNYVHSFSGSSAANVAGASQRTATSKVRGDLALGCCISNTPPQASMVNTVSVSDGSTLPASSARSCPSSMRTENISTVRGNEQNEPWSAHERHLPPPEPVAARNDDSRLQSQVPTNTEMSKLEDDDFLRIIPSNF
ncbi:hypothetical protein Tcan_05929 [Toxocara canis]|uniref:RING-type domain-containing protein n=1 Tax=Toxocara canis TaxID=6265 RepID=A0A0B2VYQ9_TOXCA|nr:hypothetical protein Tcan_05929 [Toxocara canis]